MANRLDLDFSIEGAEERKIFLTSYLEEPQFKIKPLTEAELDTCAKYLLYGKDADGTSCVQRGEVQVETKNKTWTKEGRVVSLESLLDKGENEGSYEDIVLKPHQVHYKTSRQTFSREEALQKAPSVLKDTFKILFRQIDETELIVNFYELVVGKREKPPRKELTDRFTQEEIENARQKAAFLTQYQYLKKKHLLVDLRRQQYILRDSYQPQFYTDWSKHGAPIVEDKTLTFDADMPVFPLGLIGEGSMQGAIFQDFENLNPNGIDKGLLKKISDFYWKKQNEKGKTQLFFDFTNLEHVYQLLLVYEDLRAVVNDDDEDVCSTTRQLLDTLDYYISQTHLTDSQQKVLELKLQQVKNKDIREIVNKEFNKTYNENYISTIFRQKIIKQINEVAAFHEKIVGNLFFPEEFKKCTSCGKTFLICSENFVKKTRSKDGFTNRCKNCDKILRQKRK